ncbi:HU family DNA-binding protein [Novosphingobium sp. SG916]|uniref:HU family DNA-binding protein n=1 Tax=Novosphingobium sp. SG916 TaxID=2587131 RepID=UPI0032B87098
MPRPLPTSLLHCVNKRFIAVSSRPKARFSASPAPCERTQTHGSSSLRRFTARKSGVRPHAAFWRNATMNTTELVDAVAASQGIAKAEVRKTVDAVFAAIAEAAAKGEEISLNAFGKFKVKDVPAREGRNPSTGEPIQIAASRKLSFAPAKALKDKLNG